MPELTCEHCGVAMAVCGTSQFFAYGVLPATLCALCMRAHDTKLDKEGLADRMVENSILAARLGNTAELRDEQGHLITADRAVANAKQIRADVLASFDGWLTPPAPPEA